jgi:hypothetical protein
LINLADRHEDSDANNRDENDQRFGRVGEDHVGPMSSTMILARVVALLTSCGVPVIDDAKAQPRTVIDPLAKVPTNIQVALLVICTVEP